MSMIINGKTGLTGLLGSPGGTQQITDDAQHIISGVGN